jgi:RNA polymerase sigma factor (sigma-70 family)
MAVGDPPRQKGRYRGALSSYLSQIRRFPLLTASGERRLATRSMQGEEMAHHGLVQSNLRLVVRIARDYAGRGASIEDLISEGNIGLMEAARRFDPARGARFVTYASWWIRKYVIAALNRHRAQASAPLPHDSQPSSPDAGAESRPYLVLWRRILSFSDFAVQDDRTPAEIRIPSKEPVPEDRVQERQASEVLHDVLDLLGDRERAVVEAHYGLRGAPPQSLQAIADQMNCTREWVRQIEQRAIERARRILDSRGFRG